MSLCKPTVVGTAVARRGFTKILGKRYTTIQRIPEVATN